MIALGSRNMRLFFAPFSAALLAWCIAIMAWCIEWCICMVCMYSVCIVYV